MMVIGHPCYDCGIGTVGCDGECSACGVDYNADWQKDIGEIVTWMSPDQDVLHRVMEMRPEQIAFLKKHEIVISTQYIGTVRLYKGNIILWWSIEKDFLPPGPKADIKANNARMSEMTRAFIDRLMALPEQVLRLRFVPHVQGEEETRQIRISKRDLIDRIASTGLPGEYGSTIYLERSDAEMIANAIFSKDGDR
jgi:hypothetical protein